MNIRSKYLSILFCLMLPTHLRGETNVGVGKWTNSDKDSQLQVSIDFRDHLTKKQKTLISSGFSTYSALTIILPKGKYSPERVIFESQCTIKYDTWEEYYDIIRLDSGAEYNKVKGFPAMAKICLLASVKDKPALTYFAKNGGILKGRLQLDQISKERAAKIRDWLVKQQSQVVRGLFSHMLGDLKLTEEIHIDILISPQTPKSTTTDSDSTSPKDHNDVSPEK